MLYIQLKIAQILFFFNPIKTEKREAYQSSTVRVFGPPPGKLKKSLLIKDDFFAIET